MADQSGPTLFPAWLKRALELGYSPVELARLLNTTPSVALQLIRALPKSPSEVRKLARKFGVDYESLRTFTDNALQPITGFDKETQSLLRLWQRLDAPRKAALLVVMRDMARGRAARRPGSKPRRAV